MEKAAVHRSVSKVAVGKETTQAQFFAPPSFKTAVVLANGAGANMLSPFMQTFAQGLAERGRFCALFNFLYQEKARKIPDKPGVLEETYRSVLTEVTARTKLPENRVAIGGKSMGGRIATHIASRTDCERIILLGYPLHPPGQPEKLRDAHLYAIKAKMLFISGSRDPFCDLDLLRPILSKLHAARIDIVEGGGHSLEVPKKSGVSQEDVYRTSLDEIDLFLKEDP